MAELSPRIVITGGQQRVGRVRTDRKRDEILRVASELFDDLGYDGCSMAMIAGRLGGAKGTLYGYFPSKEKLLRALLDCETAGEFERILRELPGKADLREGLVELGIAFHRKRLSSFPVASARSIARQPPRSSPAAEFYGQVIRPAFEALAAQFGRLMDQGRIRRGDPWVVLMHWKGLNDWDVFEQRLGGAIRGPDDLDLETISTLAADAFLKLYGTG